MAVKHASRVVAQYIGSLILLLAVWKGLIGLFHLPAYLLPPPERVFQTLSGETRAFSTAALYTLQNCLIGGAAGILCGMLIGGLVAYSRTLRWIIEPYLIVFQSFPRESLFPLFIVWLGFGVATKMVSASLLCFFPVAVLTLNGLLDVRSDYVELIRGWGATRWQEFLYCRLPAVVPILVSAVKVGFPLALIGSVLGEFIGGNRGLGYIIMSSGSAFRTDRIFAALVFLASIGLLMLVSIQLIERLLLKRFYQQ
jgi:ABC-type nitrate/sulfonate/bicarbonate transport system permease component